MNIYEIHEQLLLGRTLQLQFSTEEEAERFRISLAQYKARQDKQMVELGIMEEDAIQRLSMQKQLALPHAEGARVTATISFKNKAVLKDYDVVILDEEEESSGEPAS